MGGSIGLGDVRESSSSRQTSALQPQHEKDNAFLSKGCGYAQLRIHGARYSDLSKELPVMIRGRILG